MTNAQSLQLKIDGMTCNNCVNHVNTALSEMDEVAEVMITLKAGETSDVVVTLNRPVTEDRLREVIDEAGYSLVGVDAR